jgi:nucleoid-associated protein Lsr2
MVKTTVVTITDDIDGSEGAETVAFGFGGQSYEIDLSKKNLDKFKKGLQPFIDSGRRVSSRQSAVRVPRNRTSRKDSSAIRAWAAEQGLAVSERGRIPAAVVAQYEAAH